MTMMPFTKHVGRVVPLDRVNVDTDQMVPKQFCKTLTREGFGRYLFYDWRYLPEEAPNPEFVLNYPRYKGASVLLARANFGCGSSREHAPWAVMDYGFRSILAPSYADIFYNNCFKNGILPVILTDAQMDKLFDLTQRTDGYQISIDLEALKVTDGGAIDFSFEVDPFRRKCLLQGLDDIGLTCAHEAEIAAYERTNKPLAISYDPVDVKFGPELSHGAAKQH
jgi:3-isopropylmalate/(R)-2-methylmalate dehydratase small subunit